jgi:N-acylneuraminate cytidylyltransferase
MNETSHKNYVGLICARGGSKGVPGKNIRKLGGKPLIGWAIETALKVDRISRVIVSTDSEEIAQISREMGAEVPFMRPDELAGDSSPEWEVWRHALNWLSEEPVEKRKVDGLVVVPPTAPLRRLSDINACIDEYEMHEADMVITVCDSHRSPYFNMVKLNEKGDASLVLPPSAKLHRRQDVPAVYDITTVAYLARPEFVLEHDYIFAGRVRTVNVPVESGLDIDTEHDFKIAEILLAIQDGGQQ